MHNPFHSAAACLRLSFDEYSKLPHLRRSAVWDHFDQGPEVFEGRHVSRSIPPEENAAMRLGVWVRTSLLNPQVWANLASPISLSSRRTKGWREHEVKCAADGRIALLQSEHDQVARMTEAFRGCRQARQWLDNAAAVEKTIVAEFDEVKTKARIDIRTEKAIVAIKTTRDPRPDWFAKSIAKYGYWFQAAWQICHESALAARRLDELSFVIIAVESSAPYRVAIYELGPDWWGPGVAAVEWTLDRIVEERWKGQHTSVWNGHPRMLTAPGWFGRSVRERVALLPGEPGHHRLLPSKLDRGGADA